MKKLFLLVCLLSFAHLLFAQEGVNVENGKTIFTTRCAACHNFKQKLVGPSLKDVHKKRSEGWIVKFVHNSQELIASGDADAIAIFKEFGQTIMPPHPDLTDANVKEVIAYIQAESKKIDASAPPTSQATPTTTDGSASAEAPGYHFISWLVYVLYALSIIALLILFHFLIEVKSRPTDS